VTYLWQIEHFCTSWVLKIWLLLVPTFADRGVSRCQRGKTPTTVNLRFLYRGCYFFFQVTPHLCSRGWVDPVPNQSLLRKYGSARNRTRDFWVCSQELWPPDHRGGPIKSTIFKNTLIYLLHNIARVMNCSFETVYFFQISIILVLSLFLIMFNWYVCSIFVWFHNSPTRLFAWFDVVWGVRQYLLCDGNCVHNNQSILYCAWRGDWLFSLCDCCFFLCDNRPFFRVACEDKAEQIEWLLSELTLISASNTSLKHKCHIHRHNE
jgi:hypothetical protein